MLHDSLTDPKVILAVIAIIVSTIALLNNWWRSRKSLVYSIETNEALLTIKPDVKERVKILLDDKPVKNIHLIKIQVTNSGFVAIERSHFEKDISFHFEGAEIVSVDIEEQKPSDLDVTFEFVNDTLKINPLLLNRKNRFKLKVLTSSDEKPNISVASRIKDVELTKEEKDLNQKRAISIVVMIVSFTVLFIITFVEPISSNVPINFKLTLLILFFVLYMYFMIWGWERIRKKD